MNDATGLRGLYPDIAPYAHGMLDVGDGQTPSPLPISGSDYVKMKNE